MEVWRTDEKGTIVVTSDGDHITVRNTDLPPKQNAPPTETKVTQPQEEDTTAPTQESTQSVTVSITKSGEKYHRDGMPLSEKQQNTGTSCRAGHRAIFAVYSLQSAYKMRKDDT